MATDHGDAGADAETETPEPLTEIRCDGCGERPRPVVAGRRFALWCPCCLYDDSEHPRAVYVTVASRLPTAWRALTAPEVRDD